MKILNNLLRVLTFVFGLAAVVLFFLKFATVTTGSGVFEFAGSQLAFGGKIDIGVTEKVALAKSADVLFCLIVSIMSVIAYGLSVKFKGMRYAAPVLSGISGVYMLVIALSSPWLYVDTRPLTDVTAAIYTPFVLIAAVVLLVSTVVGFAYLFVSDYIETPADKLTIPKRFARFIREYKSEVRKIVWPGPRSVVKNTIVVLIVCAIVGAFIWLLDFGLGQLLNLILGL